MQRDTVKMPDGLEAIREVIRHIGAVCVIPVTVILVALIFLGEQVYEGIFIRDNVSNLSHVLGGFVGAVAGYNLNLRR